MGVKIETQEESDTPTITSAIPDDIPPEPEPTSLGVIQISAPTFAKQSYQSTQGKITGKIDDFKTGTYVTLTVTKPDGNTYDLKGILTNKGQFTVPIMIDSNWQVGKYLITGKYNGVYVGSDSFSVQ